MKRLIVLTLSFVLLSCASAFAQETTISYDDGHGEGWFADLLPDSYEGIKFFMEHPAQLLRVHIMFAGLSGDAEIHVWADGGGNDPDQAHPLIEPIAWTMPDDYDRGFVEFDLSDQNIQLPALHYVHVGLRRLEEGAGLLIDVQESPPGHSWLYPADDPTVKYGISDGEFMVRADVLYSPSQGSLFTDITEQAGITGASRMAWGDCDNDGDDDLLLSAQKLYRNNGDGTFTDISESAGIIGISGSAVWADYDNDGNLDYYAFSHGAEETDRDRLVHAEGNCTFVPVDDPVGTPWDYDRTEAAAWADYDNDGWVDLYAANYEVQGETGTGTPDRLWHNLGGGVFEDVTEAAGVVPQVPLCGRGLTWGDFNDDGLVDLYVANYRLDPNLLYINNGDGTFTEDARERGVQGNFVLGGGWGHGIGTQFGDFDNDGDLDLIVGNLAHPRFINFSDKTMLYVNSGPPDYTFTDIREESGISYSETHSDTMWFDYDNDGWLDLFITGIYTDYTSFLYRNNGDNTFEDRSYSDGAYVFNGWGVASSDFDRDGDLDFLTRKFFRNNTISPLKEDPPNWLEVSLVGSKSNRAGIGARITVEAGELRLMREVQAGKGTGAQSSLVQHFGLGPQTVAQKLTVRWVDGSITEQTDVAANQFLTITEDAQPVCENHLGECLSETRLRVCRNWEWTEEDCPEGTICIDRFCMEPPPDGDEDEPDGDEDVVVPDGDTDEEVADGDVTDGDTTDGDITDGDVTDGDVEDGDVEDGDVTDGDVIDGDLPDGDDSADGDDDSYSPETPPEDDGGCRQSQPGTPLLLMLMLGLYLHRRRLA